MLAAISKNYLRIDSMFPVSYFGNDVYAIEQKLSCLNFFLKIYFGNEVIMFIEASHPFGFT